MDTCLYTFVQNHSMHNYGLWVIILHQYRFTSCNKCTLWGRMLKMGKAMHVCDREYMGNLSTFLSILLLNSKCSQK